MPQIFGSFYRRRIYGEHRTHIMLLLIAGCHITVQILPPLLCRNGFDADIILI